MSTRVTSSRFVGRAAELAGFEAARRDAAAGRPSVVVLAGESGVGKTRLVAEFERGGGARFLRGECVEIVDGELPYAPLLAALRTLVRERDPALGLLSADARAQLGTLLPGLGDGEAVGDAPSEQLRLFEALLELLDHLGDADPVVLVIEDLHWADRSTRAFVAFLARSLRTERVLFLLTYRVDELHRRHPLRPLLAELERAERTNRIDLARFSRAELDEALTDILGAEPSSELAARIFERAEGNPLYTEELLAAGLDGRGAPPHSLRDAFMLRIERLPATAQQALRALAVAHRLDHELLGALTGLALPELHQALREAVAGHVIEAGADGRLGFRHALLREVAYDDLLPGERAELHLALAQALEARLEADGAQAELPAAIAYHYMAGGDQPAALGAAVRAAEAASRIYAVGEAASLLERALDLWPRVGDAEARTGLDHAGLLLRAAQAHNGRGDYARWEALLRSALGELDEATEGERVAFALGELARAQWSLARSDEALASARRALALLPADEDNRDRAALLAWLARTTSLRGHYREAREAARAALEAARAAGARGIEGQVLNTLGNALVGSGEFDAGIAQLREALSIAREGGNAVPIAYAYSNLADVLNLSGRTREALATALDGLAEIPSQLQRNHDWLSVTAAELSFEAGEWQQADAHLPGAERRLVGRSRINAELRRAELLLGRGDGDAAQRHLAGIDELVSQSSEPQWHGMHGVLLAELHRRGGDLDAARRAVDEALDRIELCTDDAMRIAHVAAAGVAVEADRAQHARDRGDRAQEREAVSLARMHVARVRAAAENAGPVERAWRATAAADLLRARGRSDAQRWETAATAWDKIDRPYNAALARWRAAEAAVEAGDRAGAKAPGSAALAAAQHLGAHWLARELESLSRRGRLGIDGADPDDPVPVTTDGDGEPVDDPFGLTPRERQVLALVARGATNREIGAELFMAEKTASVHVSRILAKLGVRTRTQAAAVAHRIDSVGHRQ